MRKLLILCCAMGLALAGTPVVASAQHHHTTDPCYGCQDAGGGSWYCMGNQWMGFWSCDDDGDGGFCETAILVDCQLEFLVSAEGSVVPKSSGAVVRAASGFTLAAARGSPYGGLAVTKDLQGRGTYTYGCSNAVMKRALSDEAKTALRNEVRVLTI
jgi:hypothetical protein